MSEQQTLRIGKISSINYAKGTARVTYEDRGRETTSELPFIAWEYWMPKVADQVLVGHLSNGTQAGVIIGPVWHNGKRPPAAGAKRYHKELSHAADRAYFDYQDDSDHLILKAGHVIIRVNGGTDIDLQPKLANLEQRIEWLESVASWS